jgi:putative phage-type endonuclease
MEENDEHALMTADFHELRRTGIGGSDAAAALGISPWRTPYELWREKTGEGEDAPRTVTEPMLWGTLMEPVILGEYVRRTGHAVEKPTEMLRHDKYTWMIAHLDGWVMDGRIIKRGVEFKTSRDGRGWGEPGTDEIPMHTGVQVHHYLIVTRAPVWDVAVLIGGSDFRIYTVLADPVVAGELIGRQAAFWQRVERREPPDPVNLHDASARWGRLLTPGAVSAGEDDIKAVETMRWVRQQRATLDAAEDEAKLHLMTALGEHGDSLVNAAGELLCSWRMDKGRKGYTVEAREPARRFLLKG